MKENPPEICRQLVSHWNEAADNFYFERGERKRIDHLLRDLSTHIEVCQQYDVDGKAMAGEYAAAEYGMSFLEIPNKINALRRRFHKIERACEERPGVREEANLLTVLLQRCAEEVKETYKYPVGHLPGRRASTSTTHREHPAYPVYAENSLTAQELSDLYQVRETLDTILAAERTLNELPQGESPTKALLKQHPAAVKLTGSEPEQNLEVLRSKLHKHYIDAYNLGVKTLCRAFGYEMAETAMVNEIDAIENFYDASPRHAKIKGT